MAMTGAKIFIEIGDLSISIKNGKLHRATSMFVTNIERNFVTFVTNIAVHVK